MVEITTYTGEFLSRWFYDCLDALRYDDDTKAYVAGVLYDFRLSHNDLSKESIVYAFMNATTVGSFKEHQRVGDWVLWVGIMYPSSIIQYEDVAFMLGSASYRSCCNIMNGTWPVFNVLSAELRSIIKNAAKLVSSTT